MARRSLNIADPNSPVSISKEENISTVTAKTIATFQFVCDLSSCGYVMSNNQLSELWHYDMWLATILIDLPLRKCKAIPNNYLPDFPPMDPGEYQNLKNQVRSMWISASHSFKYRKGVNGWGLFFSEDFESNVKYFIPK